jgi:hypothetical protein
MKIRVGFVSNSSSSSYVVVGIKLDKLTASETDKLLNSGFEKIGISDDCPIFVGKSFYGGEHKATKIDLGTIITYMNLLRQSIDDPNKVGVYHYGVYE